jgi:heptaprenyl diphosphate synthase
MRSEPPGRPDTGNPILGHGCGDDVTFRTPLQKITVMALLVAAASVLFSVETFLQPPVPWLRLGLANAVTLLALVWWGFQEAMVITVLRVLVGSLLVGRFLDPGFMISLFSGIVSTAVMALAMPWEGRIFSLVGISILGAISHNLAQIGFVLLVYIRQRQILELLPVLLLTGLAAGLLTGYSVYFLNRRIRVFESR